MRLFLFIVFCLFPVMVLANSGELVSSGSIEDNTISLTGTIIDTSTGDLVNTNTGTIEIIEEKIVIPDFKFIFQNPSYVLERDMEKSNYTCDETKDECKINFKLVTLEGKDISTKYKCRVDFGFITGEEDKCNPNTVIFGTGEYLVSFKVYDKNDDSNYIENNITIINPSPLVIPLEKEEESNSGSIIEETGTGEVIEESSTGVLIGTGEVLTSSGELFGSGEELISTGFILEIPEIIIEVQSGLEYLTGTTYECKKEECKINLTAVNSFTGEFVESDYKCKWSFSGGTYATEGTEEKCNPGYIDYGTGIFDIGLKIFEKANEENFKEKSITIKNIVEGNNEETNSGTLVGTGVIEETIEPIIQKVAISSGGGGSGGSSSVVYSRDIIVQSGLSKGALGYTCNKEVCKVNLEFPDRYKETCEWYFSGGEFKEKYLTTCNPGIIYFNSGDYTIKVKVFKEGEDVLEKSLTFVNNYLTHRQTNNIAPVAKITLQGKAAKYKTITNNKVICNKVDKCSINLTGEDSYDLDDDKLNYYWDFGNGEISSRSNPLSVYYTPGKYKIKLKVNDLFGKYSEEYFYVEVISKTPELDNLVINENIFSSLRINKILPNPDGRDDLEWIELKNIGNNPINIKGVVIDDLIGKGSKKFSIVEDIIIAPNEIKRFYKSYTSVSLNNSNEEVNILYDNRQVDKLYWNFSVPSGYELSTNNLKNIKSRVFIDRVVDGDTVVVRFDDGKESKLRLIGVDTPETKHPKKALEYFGKEASEFSRSILEGKRVTIVQTIDNYKDKYNRLLGYIYLEDGTLFNKYLIEKGYARAYLRYPFKYAKEFEESQKQAKKLGLGMWGDDEVKKEMLKEIKEEKEYLEEIKKEEKLDADVLFFKEERIIYDKIKEVKKEIFKETIEGINNIGNKLITWDFSEELDKKMLTKSEKKDKKIKKVNFSQSIAYQKKSLKIYGKTGKNLKVLINLGGKDYETKSDNTGKYSLKLNDLIVGEYSIISRVILDSGEEYLVPREKQLSLTEEYLENMKKYYVKKVTSNKTKKSSKIIPDIIPKTNASFNELKAYPTVINFFLLNILLGVMGFLMLFLVMRKNKLI